MTAIQVYEAVLTELNKVKAPSLSLLDFIYFFNKAVLQYMNIIYNAYEINQQKVDDLRVVKSTAILDVYISSHQNLNPNQTGFFNNVYEVNLPDDYWHILNCIVKFADTTKGNCTSSLEPEKYIIKDPNLPEGVKIINSYNTFFIGAKRLTSDASPQVISNYYFKPSYKNPYYYINTVNEANNLGSINTNETLNSEVSKYIIPVIKNYSTTDTPDEKWFSKLNFIFKNGMYAPLTVTLDNIDTSINGNPAKSISSLYRILLKLKNQIKVPNLTDSTKLPYFKNMKINLIDELHLEVSSFDLMGIEAFEKINTSSGTVENLLNSYVLISKNNSNFLVEKESYVRYGNSLKTKMEIRYGENKNIIPVKVLIDYLKAPQQINLTEDLINDIEDNSQILEFPDYVVYEIINNLVKLILENNGNPRINSANAVNTTIGSGIPNK